jgi:hypothetical protein
VNPLPLIVLLGLAPALTLAGEAHHGHEHAAHTHGVAKLEIAIDGPTVTLHLEAPQEALLGFEHAPRSAQERTAAEALLKALASGGELFAPTAAAGCAQKSSGIAAPVLQAAPGKARAEEHRDVDADYVFTCKQPNQLTGLEARLFDKFPRLKRLEAQVAGPRGQKAMKLTGKMRFLSW